MLILVQANNVWALFLKYNTHINMHRDIPGGLDLHKELRNGNLGILRAGEIVFHSQEYNSYLSSTKCSALVTYIQLTLCKLDRFYL